MFVHKNFVHWSVRTDTMKQLNLHCVLKTKICHTFMLSMNFVLQTRTVFSCLQPVGLSDVCHMMVSMP